MNQIHGDDVVLCIVLVNTNTKAKRYVVVLYKFDVSAGEIEAGPIFGVRRCYQRKSYEVFDLDVSPLWDLNLPILIRVSCA